VIRLGGVVVRLVEVRVYGVEPSFEVTAQLDERRGALHAGQRALLAAGRGRRRRRAGRSRRPGGRRRGARAGRLGGRSAPAAVVTAARRRDQGGAEQDGTYLGESSSLHLVSPVSRTSASEVWKSATICVHLRPGKDTALKGLVSVGLSQTLLGTETL